jgi:putative transposase
MAPARPGGTAAYGTDAGGISDPGLQGLPMVDRFLNGHHRCMRPAFATATAAAAAPAPSAPSLYRASLPFARRLQPLQGRSAAALSAALSDRRVWVNTRLLAWVLLPDGWLGLVQASALDSPHLRLERAREAGQRAWVRLGGEGSLWAAGGLLSALAGPVTPLEVARDLVMAPIRAGLAQRVGDYPFWDAVWLDAASERVGASSATTT